MLWATIAVLTYLWIAAGYWTCFLYVVPISSHLVLLKGSGGIDIMAECTTPVVDRFLDRDDPKYLQFLEESLSSMGWQQRVPQPMGQY